MSAKTIFAEAAYNSFGKKFDAAQPKNKNGRANKIASQYGDSLNTEVQKAVNRCNNVVSIFDL